MCLRAGRGRWSLASMEKEKFAFRHSCWLHRSASRGAAPPSAMSSSRASVLASLANLRHRSLAKRLAEGLRAPAAVSIAALTESAQDLTPSKNLRNAQLLHDELVARRASMVACMLRLPEEIRDQAHVAALTEAQHSRLLRMMRSQRPRSHEEVGRFDAELSEWRDDGDDQDGESRRAIGAALGEVAQGCEKEHQGGDPSEWQMR